ncbi:MAG: hypothetical protein OXI79_17875 [Gammaproteobacteria bacterium]|nr:hypothetical protein [Gammaproteobacteria bacterium]
MRDVLGAMDKAQGRYERRLKDWSISYMSLARMFPDEEARVLASAAGRGRIGRIDELVAAGVDVNARGRSDGTALWWALRKRNLKGFTRLLEHGADPNQLMAGPYYDTTTVMHKAAEHGNPAFLASALKHGGDPNVRAGSSDWTPLFVAHEVTALRMLLDTGADVKVKSSYGLTAARLNSNRPALLYELLVRGAPYDATLVSKFAGHCSLADDREADCEKVRNWFRSKNVNVPEQGPF